jgi:methionyl-tRNA formyltransferase
MRVAVIGRTEILYDAAERLLADGHEIALVVTAKEAPEYLVGTGDFEALADRVGAAFIGAGRIGDAAARIATLGPIDVAISMNYPGLIPRRVIDLFRLGILNAHPGDLPRYRGNACTAWAILNGEDRAAVCIHRMDERLDSGDIVARDYHPIDLETDVGTLWDWLRARIPGLFAEALRKLEADPRYVLEAQSADPADALRCYPRRPEDGRIDWTRSAVEIIRLINASNRPYPGAFCFLDGEKLVVRKARLVEDGERFLAVPGQVTAIAGGAVQVATGAGKVEILEVEREGEPVSVAGLIASLRIRLG